MAKKTAENMSEVSDNAKFVANWITGPLMALVRKNMANFDDIHISPAQLADLLRRVKNGDISTSVGKKVLEKMWYSGESAGVIIERDGLAQINDEKVLSAMADKIITDNPKQVEQYRGGKLKLFGFFVGEMMKASDGKCNPILANKLLREKLELTP